MNKFIIILLVALTSLPLAAVTDREMEEARTTAAKLYLRWANDASGYLDEISPKTMAELTAGLKSKEKENLVAFNAVKTPADYAGWDKEKLVEYWGKTFFASPGLDPMGVRAKGRVANKIKAMNVSAPAATETASATSTATPVETPASLDAAIENVDEMPAVGETSPESDILGDQKAMSKDAAEAALPSVHQGQNHTWVYILVLAILIAVVIWLVAYAAKLMKQPAIEATQQAQDEPVDVKELRQQAKTALEQKNKEIDDLHARLQQEESKNAALGMELEKLKLELKRANSRMAALREESSRASAPSPQPRQAQQPAVGASSAAATETQNILKVIYLGRANNRGIFVRADRRINPGNTVYRLDTNDGLVGTFHVVDEPEVVETAISDPATYLETGCTGNDLDDTAGVTRIVTESAGTAIFENNYWKILRKTRIRYE